MKKSFKEYLFICAGTLSFAIGVTALLVPILPTTPFLILSAYLYVRSSKRLYDWLINHKLFGRYLYDYITYGAVEKKFKILMIVVLWISIIVSTILFWNIYASTFLILFGIGLSLYLFSLKTLEKDK